MLLIWIETKISTYIISSPDGSEDLENTNLQDTKTVSTYSSNNDVNGSKLNTSSTTKSISTGTYSSINGGTKLTVAQRARLAADSPNIIDVSNHRHTDTNQSLSLKEGQETPQKLNKKSENKPPKTKINTPTRLRSRSASPGVFTNFGKRMVSAIDNSIIGVKVPPQGETGRPKQRAGTPVPDRKSWQLASSIDRNEPVRHFKSMALHYVKSVERRKICSNQMEMMLLLMEGHLEKCFWYGGTTIRVNPNIYGPCWDTSMQNIESDLCWDSQCYGNIAVSIFCVGTMLLTSRCSTI